MEGGPLCKILPELTDVVRDLPDGGGAGPRAGGREAAGVSRVPDVGDVGGDCGATGGGGNNTADSKACSTGGVRGTTRGLQTLSRSCQVTLPWWSLTWELVTQRPRLVSWRHSEFLN